ncbi:unnamed protein product [Cyprideis torosa]|uniref:Uncharacterized protein n=1 Tax=Cyprideis torosa TaxID=163714 RepID=A0A7R8WCZ7_9CRUS|nr:unnamed protein product [Cyprideis torosa]CAG0894114.1 unnamed protein product [Cyprideis torosa]
MASNDSDYSLPDEHTNGATQLEDGGGSGAAAGNEEEDKVLADIKARVKEMEEEAVKLKQLQMEADKSAGGGALLTGAGGGSTTSLNSGVSGASPVALSIEEKIEADSRSIYVGNVDYYSSAEELESHFHGCGSINRVTIQCDKFTGHPKGFAYVEFADKESVAPALALDESLFRGRQIKVMPKRTNQPGVSSSNRGIPLRGMPVRAGFRGNRGFGFRGGRGGFRPRGGFRGRARGHYFSPY